MPYRVNLSNTREIIRALNCIVIIIGILFPYFLYSHYYTLHQDLAGGVLTNALAAELGDVFANYNIYSPPIEAIWYSVPVYIHRALGWDLSAILVTQTSLATLASASIGYRIWSANTAPNGLMFSVSFLILLLAPIASKNIFGQREPMIILGLWPYLALRVSEERRPGSFGYGMRSGLGIWLGFFLLFKPFYSVVVLLVELAHAMHRRKPGDLFRVENVLAGGIVALYALLWLGLDPARVDSIVLYKATIVANEINADQSLKKIAVWLLPALILMLIALRKGGNLGEQFIVSGVLIGTILVAWSQQRWYTHHVFPILMTYVFWWLIIRHRWSLSGHVFVVAALLYVFYGQSKQVGLYQGRAQALNEALRAGNISLAGKRVGVLSHHPSPYNEVLVNNGALRWTPTMNITYVTAEYFAQDIAANNGKPLPPISFKLDGARILHGQLMQLWSDSPPDYLILDETHMWPLKHIFVRWQDAFSGDSAFNDIFSRYRLILDHDGDSLRFKLYARDP